MKKLLPLLLIVLASCTKEKAAQPADNNSKLTSTVSKPIMYEDNSISIADFQAQKSGNTIVIGFITHFEKDIQKIEVLKGCTANNLCSIYKQDVNNDSYATITYTINDDTSNQNTSTLYYMIKYTLSNGDWAYTPVYKLKL